MYVSPALTLLSPSAAVDVSSYSTMLSGSAAPKRYLAYTAAFSRQATVRQLYEFLGSRLRLRPEDTRLWHLRDEVRTGTVCED